MKTAGLSANVSNVSGVDFRRVEGQGERGGDVSREQTRAPENWGLASASLGGEGRSAAPCPELRQLTYHRGGRLDPQFTVTAELAKGWLRANSDVSLAALLSCQPFRGQVTENQLLSGFSFVKEPPGECRAQPACSLSQWNRAVRVPAQGSPHAERPQWPGLFSQARTVTQELAHSSTQNISDG